MSLQNEIEKYGLEIKSYQNLDLRTLYPQPRPNEPLNQYYKEYCMKGSPHKEIAECYFNKGEKWLKHNWIHTRYGKMMTFMGKTKYPSKIPNLCESVKSGYLREGYEQNFIVVLQESFAITRYCRKDIDPQQVPEVWSGHHRIGILLALGYKNVKVAIAEDKYPKTKFTNGKIHKYCEVK